MFSCLYLLELQQADSGGLALIELQRKAQGCEFSRKAAGMITNPNWSVSPLFVCVLPESGCRSPAVFKPGYGGWVSY